MNSGENSNNARKEKVVTEMRYLKRQSIQPKYLDDYYLNVSVKSHIDYCHKLSVVPQTYHEAIPSDNLTKSKEAMESEMKSLPDNYTFTVTKLPDNRTPLGGRSVYSVKLGQDATEQLEAHYVAKGYNKIEEFETEIFYYTPFLLRTVLPSH
jgi:hypothetical protein